AGSAVAAVTAVDLRVGDDQQAVGNPAARASATAVAAVVDAAALRSGAAVASSKDAVPDGDLGVLSGEREPAGTAVVVVVPAVRPATSLQRGGGERHVRVVLEIHGNLSDHALGAQGHGGDRARLDAESPGVVRRAERGHPRWLRSSRLDVQVVEDHG